MRNRITAVVVFLLIHFQAFAQEFSVSQTLDTNHIRIGERVELHINLQYKQEYAIQLPALADSIPEGLELLNIVLKDSTLKDGLMQKKYLAMLTSFDSGVYLIPSVYYVFSKNDLADTLYTIPLGLIVESPVVDTTKDVFDIKPPLGAPLTLQEVAFWTCLIILTMMVITITVLLIRKRLRKQPLLENRKNIEPPDIIALRELDKLKEEKLWQQGKTKEYYTRLTEIVRLYIESRFQVTAMEQTSSEILYSLRFTALEDESTFQSLKQLLELADMVKFAKALPLPDENEGNMLNAYVFINRTRIQTQVQHGNDYESSVNEDEK